PFMFKNEFQNLIDFLLLNYKVIAPQYDIEGNLHLQELKAAKELYLGSELALDSWKWFILPPKQQMFNYQGLELKEIMPKIGNQAFLGVSILDLQALTLLNQVFEKDAYYQQIKKKTIVIGTSFVPEKNFYKFFEKFEENKLEHLQFDIFLAVQKDKYEIYTGTEDGQRLLDEFGYKDYSHIEYAGPIREEGLDPQMVAIKDAMQNHHNQKIWDDLGKRCMQCGKCTIACPVCFCFRMFDQSGLVKDSGTRSRCWDSCFYNEFTQVAGIAPEAPKHRLLNLTAQKIYFWYEHHFVRTPTTFSLPGCVGCGRCTRTCPADIDIFTTIKDILKK
ncbi:MAG: 4Fe-4S dicluster domain-containing protein, partial [Candidatus Parcubacteria bacterium]|nr:4Fe-4S dicluster domain-containing protein [Candidatus Parcubacteria bacterium]